MNLGIGKVKVGDSVYSFAALAPIEALRFGTECAKVLGPALVQFLSRYSGEEMTLKDLLTQVGPALEVAGDVLTADGMVEPRQEDHAQGPAALAQGIKIVFRYRGGVVGESGDVRPHQMLRLHAAIAHPFKHADKSAKPCCKRARRAKTNSQNRLAKGSPFGRAGERSETERV